MRAWRIPFVGPLPAVVLALDPAAQSGYAILAGAPPHAAGELPEFVPGPMSPHELLALGELNVGTREGARRMREVVEEAAAIAEERGLPLVVAREDWANAGSRGKGAGRERAQMFSGLGRSWGRWEFVIDEVASVPKARRIPVDMGTWRAGILGRPYRRKSAVWKRAAQLYVRARWSHVPEDVSSDAAEASCVGLWAMDSIKLWKRLPKGVLRRHGCPIHGEDRDVKPANPPVHP